MKQPPSRGDTWHCERYSRGMTLVEILSVLAIIGIVLALTIPALDLFRSQTSVKYSARTVQSLFQQARGMATAQGKNILVEVRLDNDSIAIWDETKANLLSKRWFAPAAVEIKDVNGNSAIANYDLVFKPNGGAFNSISVHIKRRDGADDDSGKYYTVTVVNTTGASRIYPYKQN